MLLLDAVLAYAVAGVLIAIAFVTFGLRQVLPADTPLTFSARLLFVPGAAALWPYVLMRWIKAR